MKDDYVPEMLEDGRPIVALIMSDDKQLWGGSCAACTMKIVAYEENGEMAPVVWFAVYRDGRLDSRINSKYVKEVQY